MVFLFRIMPYDLLYVRWFSSTLHPDAKSFLTLGEQKNHTSFHSKPFGTKITWSSSDDKTPFSFVVLNPCNHLEAAFGTLTSLLRLLKVLIQLHQLSGGEEHLHLFDGQNLAKAKTSCFFLRWGCKQKYTSCSMHQKSLSSNSKREVCKNNSKCRYAQSLQKAEKSRWISYQKHHFSVGAAMQLVSLLDLVMTLVPSHEMLTAICELRSWAVPPALLQ